MQLTKVVLTFMISLIFVAAESSSSEEYDDPAENIYSNFEIVSRLLNDSAKPITPLPRHFKVVNFHPKEPIQVLCKHADGIVGQTVLKIGGGTFEHKFTPTPSLRIKCSVITSFIEGIATFLAHEGYEPSSSHALFKDGIYSCAYDGGSCRRVVAW